MKTILKELGLKGLKAKQVFILLYFLASIFSLALSDDTPLWVWLIVTVNLAASGLLVKKHIKL